MMLFYRLMDYHDFEILLLALSIYSANLDLFASILLRGP